MSKTITEKIESSDTNWQDVTMVSGYTSHESLPMKYRIKNNILYLQGAIQVEDSFPNTNTRVFSVPNISLSRRNIISCDITNTPLSITMTGGQGSAYVDTGGGIYLANVKQLTNTVARIWGVIPLD